MAPSSKVHSAPSESKAAVRRRICSVTSDEQEPIPNSTIRLVSSKSMWAPSSSWWSTMCVTHSASPAKREESRLWSTRQSCRRFWLRKPSKSTSSMNAISEGRQEMPSPLPRSPARLSKCKRSS
eukprot:scaffold261208_cov26-Tisochrysis_lutea.AAC.2